MKVLKKACVLVLVGIMGSGIVGCSNKVDSQSGLEKQDDTIIAKVNQKNITRKALEQQLVYLDTTMQWQYGEDYANNKEAMAYYEEQKRLIVDYLVEVQVLIAQANSLGVKVTDQDVADQLELLKADYDTEEAFKEALTTSGMTLDELKIMLKEDLIVNQVITACSDNITVTDEEAKTYYKSNLNQFKVEAGATMYHILVDTKEKANQIKQEMNQGKSFEELAKQYGTDDTKNKGGLLDYIPYNSTSYDADFLAAAKTLKEGEISEPVKTQYGWHLIKVANVNKEATVKTFEEVVENIKTNLLTEKQNAVVDEKLKGWKSKMDIEIYEDHI